MFLTLQAGCPCIFIQHVLTKWQMMRKQQKYSELEVLAQMGLNVNDFNLDRTKFAHYSQIHGIFHVYRVMMNVLQIAKNRQSFEMGKWAFLAAYIHDMARQDDDIDAEHGARSAKTVLPRYEILFRLYGAADLQLQFIAQAVWQHSIWETLQPDDPGYEVMAILKDADALDRCRFNGLSPRLLRYDESRDLISYGETIVENTRDLTVCNIEFEEFISLAHRSGNIQ